MAEHAALLTVLPIVHAWTTGVEVHVQVGTSPKNMEI